MSPKPIPSFLAMLTQQKVNPITDPVTEIDGSNMLPCSTRQELTEDEKVDLILNKSNCKKAIQYNDFSKAIEFQQIVLNLIEKQFGTLHMQTVGALCTLAQCHYKDHQPHTALEIYSQALHTTAQHFPEMEATLAEIKNHIEQCKASSRRMNGISHLTTHMTQMNIKAQINQDISDAYREARLLNIANQLFAKQKFNLAAVFFKAWTELALPKADIHDETVYGHIGRYGRALMLAGQSAQALQVFKQLVLHRNANHAACKTGEPLHKALCDLARCLETSGATSSAQMTFQLALKVLKPEDFAPKGL